MIKQYTFFDGGTVKFESTKSVKELIQYAFDVFDYYEPAGMELVTIFQAHNSKTNVGWFTTDTSRSCEEEIEDTDWLSFAYYLPNVFYFAEGGWDRYMTILGNHPEIPNPVALSIRFKDFDNRVVINGNYCFNDVLSYLIETKYISSDCNKILISPGRILDESYAIYVSDEIMSAKLTDFSQYIQERTEKKYKSKGFISHVFINIF